LLLLKGSTLEQGGDSFAALDVLSEATKEVDDERDPRTAFGIQFNLATVFCNLDHFQDADQLLPQVRERAERLDNGLDLVRVEWLEAKVAVGLGREEEAEAGLQRVRKQFEARPLPADAALVALELARLYLRQGRTAKTRELAAEAAPVLENLGVEHQAQQAVALFWQAARTEAATLELVERAIDALRRARPAARHA
jgi:tetratricopeptide (TPR) repeat protein